MVSPDVTHVAVGYSSFLMNQLDRLLPAGSVLVIEEPEICAARDVARQIERFECAAGLVEAATQDEAGAERLADLVERPAGVRAVLPSLEYAVLAAAELAEAWGLPSGGAKAVRAFRDKALLREIAQQHGIAQPEWQRAVGASDVERFRDEHGGECVLKPTHLSASVGVQLLGPADDLDEAWKLTEAADEALLRVGRGEVAGYLVEERLHGAEFSIEALVHEGRIAFLNTTDTQLFAGRHPVELGHIVPATALSPADPAASAAMSALVAATGFKSGILHAEWILRDGRPHLLECAARMPGDYIPLLIALAYESDLIRGFVSVLEGQAPEMATAAVHGSAVRFLEAESGAVAEIRGLDAARALPGVVDVFMSVEPGQVVERVTSSWSRAGEVVAVGRDSADAADIARTAAATVDIVTGRDGGPLPEQPTATTG